VDDARERDERGRMLPTGNPTDYSRYQAGAKDEAALAAKAARGRADRAAAAAAAGRETRDGRERLTVLISFRVSEETAAEIVARTPDGGKRNTTARDILLGALEAGQGEDNQREEGQQRWPSQMR
jgi:hypothetical protein